ncbi:MAG: UrcA family protein [Erythrobacter sp.]
MKLIALAPAALGLALAATPALAQLPEQRTVTFTTSDINLATPRGQKELNWRIDRAIRHVCQLGHRDAGSRILTDDARTCITKARNSAQQQVAALMAAEARKGA